MHDCVGASKAKPAAGTAENCTSRSPLTCNAGVAIVVLSLVTPLWQSVQVAPPCVVDEGAVACAPDIFCQAVAPLARLAWQLMQVRGPSPFDTVPLSPRPSPWQ